MERHLSDRVHHKHAHGNPVATSHSLIYAYHFTIANEDAVSLGKSNERRNVYNGSLEDRIVHSFCFAIPNEYGCILGKPDKGPDAYCDTYESLERCGDPEPRCEYRHANSNSDPPRADPYGSCSKRAKAALWSGTNRSAQTRTFRASDPTGLGVRPPLVSDQSFGLS